MKIYINSANEDWICDRLRFEFYNHLKENCVSFIEEADVIWVMAPWVFNYHDPILSEKKVVTTIHHIDPNKIDLNFLSLINEKSDFIHFVSEINEFNNKKYFTKPTFSRHWWINSSIFKPTDKSSCLDYFDLPNDKFYVGSFQRDTEGSDLISPKLSKGPDLFCDIVEDMYSKNNSVHVLLAGWRRQYVINRLNQKNIPYTYKEMLSFEELNLFYNCLDLYIVSSRCEGGPQAIPECASTKTPIVSTNVGCANTFLSEDSIYNDLNNFYLARKDTAKAYENCVPYFMARGLNWFYLKFKDLFVVK